jgi:hypothetical protein
MKTLAIVAQGLWWIVVLAMFLIPVALLIQAHSRIVAYANEAREGD